MTRSTAVEASSTGQTLNQTTRVRAPGILGTTTLALRRSAAELLWPDDATCPNDTTRFARRATVA
jgi:hypothetical protein